MAKGLFLIRRQWDGRAINRMSVKTLNSLVNLSPGFKTSVNLKADIEDDRKVSGYIPTEIASEVLLDLAENLHPLAGRRSRILTGTYGTGKSHLALVLARLYRDGVKNPALAPVIDKLKKWPGQAQRLIEERTHLNGRFLLVLLEGDEGPFDDTLLRYLDDALEREGIKDILPETAFSAAVARIEQIRRHNENTFKGLEDVSKEFGFESVTVLEGQLKNKQRTAYDAFCEIHKVLFAGASFYQHHLMTPKEVYEAVAKKLVDEKGYGGIVVIWDEFGRYIERVINDPRGIEGQNIQTFADGCCNRSGKYHVHLYLICHRSLQEYVGISTIARTTGMSKADQVEWNKISGRFRQFDMKSTDKEVFDLIDQVLIQKESDQLWKEFIAKSADFMDDWTEQSMRLRIFPEFNRNEIHTIITLGAYPLHPMAAFCLPRISQRVAQNERTLFTFLSDSGTDTLGPFIHDTIIPSLGVYPPCFTADMLWNFFARDVAEHPVYRRIYSKFSQADFMVDPDNELGKRIIKAVALLQVISTDRAPCTEDVISFALGLRSSERSELRDMLKSLCSKQGDRERVLVQSVTDGSYRFTGVASDGFDEKVNRIVEERMRSVRPTIHLSTIADRLQIPSTIPATSYSDDFMLARSLALEIVDCGQIQDSQQWIRNLGSGEFRDGYALIILCENGDEIRKAKELSLTTLKHPQILIGVPKEPIYVTALLRKHEAICFLETTQSNLYGKGADFREEWEQQERDYIEAINKIIGPILNPEKRLLDWFTNAKEITSIGSVSRLRNVASDMMRSVFPLTPCIAHERLTTDEGRDNFVGPRRAIINKLLLIDGPDLLANETTSQFKTVIDFVYRKNGILRQKGNSFIIDKPDENKFSAMSSVWNEIERTIEDARRGPVPMSMLISILRKPPYGLRMRSISLIIAAVFRKYLQRGNLSFQYEKSKLSISHVIRIDGTVLDDVVFSSEKYSLVFTDIGQKQEAVLFGVAMAFNVSFTSEVDKVELIEHIHESVKKWWRRLPPFAQNTKELDEQTKKIRDKILRMLAQEEADAQKILLNTIVDTIQPVDQKQIIVKEAVAELFGKAKENIDNAVEKQLVPRIKTVVEEVFSQESETNNQENALAVWFRKLSQERQDMRIAGDATILARGAKSVADGGKNAVEGALSLAKDITGTSLENWGDDMLERFRGRLEGAKRAVEEAETVKITPPKNGNEITIPEPHEGQVHIVLSIKTETLRRTFVPVSQISTMGENLRTIIKESIKGIGKALPSGECETILIEILRDILQ